MPHNALSSHRVHDASYRLKCLVLLPNSHQGLPPWCSHKVLCSTCCCLLVFDHNLSLLGLVQPPPFPLSHLTFKWGNKYLIITSTRVVSHAAFDLAFFLFVCVFCLHHNESSVSPLLSIMRLTDLHATLLLCVYHDLVQLMMGRLFLGCGFHPSIPHQSISILLYQSHSTHIIKNGLYIYIALVLPSMMYFYSPSLLLI